MARENDDVERVAPARPCARSSGPARSARACRARRATPAPRGAPDSARCAGGARAGGASSAEAAPRGSVMASHRLRDIGGPCSPSPIPRPPPPRRACPSRGARRRRRRFRARSSRRGTDRASAVQPGGRRPSVITSRPVSTKPCASRIDEIGAQRGARRRADEDEHRGRRQLAFSRRSPRL